MEKKLPIGIEDFKEIRQDGYYYIDKTGLIRELLQNQGAVNFFTRPRKFGKSLNMSMLRCFFEIGGEKSLFDGLEIAREAELCSKYMGKFPVISISLKSLKAETFESAKEMAVQLVNKEARRLQFLLESNRLTQYGREALLELLSPKMSEITLLGSLKLLTELLCQHYGQKVIVLIDGYDAPLDKAYKNGYYDQMVILLWNLFGQALKTNEYLQFAVLTGCLRIVNESIFTGFNNFRVFSVADVYLDEYFGFTDQEVRKLLSDYGLEEHFEETKAWYDGYRFGDAQVYCPWDVINYCSDLCLDPQAEPQAYWANTSENAIVRMLLQKATAQTKRELEHLVAGETVEKWVIEELTYNEFDKTIENLWSVLFVMGYLTRRGEKDDGSYSLIIPNREIRELFVTQVWEWFQETVHKDNVSLREFCKAFQEGKAEEVEERFQAYLRKNISIGRKESFYHGVLLGLLSSEEEWILCSNAESGDGYSNILVKIEEEDKGIVIEVKYSEDGEMERDCAKALEQIREKDYGERLRRDGMERILAYGVACCRKKCRVAYEELRTNL